MSLVSLTADLRAALATVVPGCVDAPSPAHLSEPRGTWQGQAGALVRPRSVDEVARVIRFANANRVGVVPWGGGTGLVGGQVLQDGPLPIVLSLERIARMRDIWPEENVAIAEAGMILADLQSAAAGVGRLFPLSLASEGSARIGGLLGTNAGGVGVLRYGNARDLCLGIEAVLPDGSILQGLKRLRKDNTGYDLRHLLIGAEGTLGVITAAALRLFPRPAASGTAIMVVRDPGAALTLLRLAEARGGVSAFELISGQGLRFLTETARPVRQPFAAVPEWCVLVDLGLPQGGDPQADLEALFSVGLDAGLVSDGVIAQNEAQRAELWAVRETIPEANRLVGAIVSNDISLPLSTISEFLDRCGAALTQHGPYRLNAFGHLGDGNLHYNIFPPPGRAKAAFAQDAEALRAIVDGMVMELGGSFSAEHGVGRLKVGQLERFGDPGKLAAMRAIKTALDPAGILNPGAVLRG